MNRVVAKFYKGVKERHTFSFQLLIQVPFLFLEGVNIKLHLISFVNFRALIILSAVVITSVYLQPEQNEEKLSNNSQSLNNLLQHEWPLRGIFKETKPKTKNCFLDYSLIKKF